MLIISITTGTIHMKQTLQDYSSYVVEGFRICSILISQNGAELDKVEKSQQK